VTRCRLVVTGLLATSPLEGPELYDSLGEVLVGAWEAPFLRNFTANDEVLLGDGAQQGDEDAEAT
jgi:hypothetical protein